MTYTTGNTTRDEMLRKAIAAFGADYEAVKAALPADFDVAADEIAGTLGDMEPTQPVAADDITFEEPSSSSDLPYDPVTGNTLAAPLHLRPHGDLGLPPGPVAAPKPLKKIAAPREITKTQSDAVGAVNSAQNLLAECRIVVRQRTAELQEKRAALSEAIRNWQINTATRYTALDQQRDYQKTSQALRAARAAAGLSATANAFVRKRMVNRGNMRGAYPQSWVGRTDPRYVPPEK